MTNIKHAIILFSSLITTTLISMALATPGTATYYDTYLPSACYGYQDHGTMIAAANPDMFESGASCGKSLTVSCTGATNQGVPHPCRDGSEVTVTIVDLCPSCESGHIDLSLQAFSRIANPDAGKIRISYS